MDGPDAGEHLEERDTPRPDVGPAIHQASAGLLVAGGIQPMTDGERTANESNPRGYFELTKVKQLPQRNDWLDQARGGCFEIVAPLNPHLPQRIGCRVIVMSRDLDEIAASQRRMLERGRQESAKLSDAQLNVFLRQHSRRRPSSCSGS